MRRFAGALISSPAAIVLSLAAMGSPAASALAAPAQVVIIRHGEKPPMGNELDPRGFERAQALVGFFENDPAVARYGAPVAIYAMAPSRAGGSIRAIQTVTPLAQNLGLSVDRNFTREQLAELVQDVMRNSAYAGRTVVICWEHSVIPEMARDFGWTSGPSSWPGGDFYSAWILSFAGDAVSDFKIVSEHVLPGDPSN